MEGAICFFIEPDRNSVPIFVWVAKMSRLFSFFLGKPRMTLIARMALPLFEVALVLVRLDHAASLIKDVPFLLLS